METNVSSVVTGLEWALSVCRPAHTALQAMKMEKKDGFMAVITRYWAAPILLAIASDFLVFHLFGVSIETNPFFTAFYVAVSSLSAILNAGILYLCLRLAGSKHSFARVACAYTPYVVYYPFYSFLGFYKTYNIYAAIRFLKYKHLGLQDSLIFYFKHNKEIVDSVDISPPSAYIATVQTFSILCSLFAALIVAEIISQSLQIDRFKSYLSIVVASFLGFAPKAVGLAQWAILIALTK